MGPISLRPIPDSTIPISYSTTSKRNNELTSHFPRLVCARMPCPAPCPIDVRKRRRNATARVLHAQQRREVLLLRITHLGTHARELELGPDPLVLHNQPSVPTSQDEELGAHAEALEGDFRRHYIVPSCHIPAEAARLVLENFYEALV